jgi:hypothetical protein
MHGIRTFVPLGAAIIGALVMAARSPMAAELPSHVVTVPSIARIQFQRDGSWKMDTQSTRFETYGAIPDVLRGSSRFPPRLATITTITTFDGDSAEYRTAVAIDDMSGPTLRRVSEFSDPGSEGTVLGGLFFVTTEPGCCALPSRHHVRALETGKLLFSSTGIGDVGAVAWMQVPNASPTVERWAAFEGNVGSSDYETPSRKIGDLLYGDRHGVLSRVALRLKPGAAGPKRDDGTDDLDLDIATCGFLLWIEPGRVRGPGRPTRPAGNECRGNSGYSPDSLFSLEHRPPDQKPSGFEVELSGAGTIFATIPVKDDRLDLAHARLDDRLILMEFPAP